jgi:hypothetical protein
MSPRHILRDLVQLIVFGLLTETEKPHGTRGDPSIDFRMGVCTSTVPHSEPQPPTYQVGRSRQDMVIRLNQDSQFVNGRSRI